VTEVPLLYETGGDERFDKVVVITAPKALREARREPLPGDRETRLIDDKEKMKRADYAYVNTGSLESSTGSSVGRSKISSVRRSHALTCSSPAAAGVAAWFVHAPPDFDPEASAIRSLPGDRHGPRAQLPPRAGAARRCDLRGVEVPGGREVVVGSDRPDAAAAVDRGRASRCTRAARTSGGRISTTRRSTCRYGSWYSATCSTSTTTSEKRSPPYNAGQGQRRPLARGGSGIRFSGDAVRTSQG
jgi:hypothetical protein